MGFPISHFLIGNDFIYLQMNFANKKVMENSSYETSQFEEVIFCCVNDVSMNDFLIHSVCVHSPNR